jgi:type IV pilus assembly protein PilM
MPLFSKQDTATVGLDIDGEYLAAAVVDGGSIGRMASIDMPAGITTDGEVTDEAALAEVLKRMFADHKLPRRVRLGVVNQQIVVRHLDMPLIEDAAEREAAVRFQAADAIAMPLEDAVLDFQVIGAHETQDGSVRQRIMVVAARTSMISKLVRAVKAAGLKADGIDLNAFALVRVLGGAQEGAIQDPEHPARVICHLGGVTNLAIAVGDICVFTRPLQTPWSDDEATANSVAEEIRLSIDFYQAGPDARPVDSILLSGPGADNGAVRDALQVRTGLGVAVAQPLGTLDVQTVPAQEDPSRYTIAAGLALGAKA